ncbi:hypothetical protein [Halosimplex amylolyticum]|uniref:hypothetical protein n=1 Tax=Halosimplex amylolyticum TaxID=3396616 RepID=UPI003F56519A
MRTDITLRGDDSEQFEKLKKARAEKRHGNEPSNAEMLRLLMEDYDGPEVRGGLTR